LLLFLAQARTPTMDSPRNPRWLLAGLLLAAGCWSLDYGVELNPYRSPVAVGDTVRLTAEFYADGPGFPLGPGRERVYTSRNRPQRFQWSSSDPSVLEVDSGGLVLGIAPGRATVTAQVGQVVSRGLQLTVQ
jgi:uncharacterized protein YjdB